MDAIETVQDATNLTGPSLEQHKRLELVVKLLPSEVATVVPQTTESALTQMEVKEVLIP